MRLSIALATLLFVSTAGAAGDAANTQATRVVMLGTGTPNADPDHSGPATAIVVGNQAYLVDFGPGVVRRASAAARQHGIDALKPERLDLAFVTHLHSDHTTGYPDLIFTPWVLDRSGPLRVYGPPGLSAMTDHILAAYAEDIDIRLHGGEPSNTGGHRVEAHEVKPGVAYRDEHVTVTAFAVPHGKWKYAYGYRFDTPDRRIVISGDTAPSDAVVRACDGCDVLIHEVISTSTFAAREPEWQRYHAAYHTRSRDLADIARRAKPKLLVLYHQLYGKGGTDDDLIREIREAGYEGKVVSAQDLQVF
ncbi:MBL fold metallo-hydrolase [Lysobacter tyrosinilyticus]